MKKVVSIDMVAHLWANQSQSEARNAQGNFYFYSDSIYSYGNHFKIAKHVTNDSGTKAVLYSDRTYSVTTSKQQWIVKAAIQGQNVIIVPDASNAVSQNFATWISRIKEIAKNLANARKPEKYLNPINAEYGNACKYAGFIGIEIPKDLKDLYTSIFTPEYKQSLQDDYKRIQAEKRQYQKQLEDLFNINLTDWHNGETTRLNVPYQLQNTFSYLRLSKDGDQIQTSQNVFIPLSIAKDFYKTILETVKNGGCTNCGTRFMHNYNVKEITAKRIIVGCHTIEISEIERLTSSLNW